MCFSGDPLQLQHNITLASGLVDHLFFCRLMLELASGKTTVMGEAGDGWFSVFASSPTLFANLCIVSTWFHILTNLSFFGISRWMFSLLHTSHCVGQRQQGLYTAKGSHKSLLQVFKSLGLVWESKLNLFRFLNLLYYRGRGILLIRNPFLAILSMFRS